MKTRAEHRLQWRGFLSAAVLFCLLAVSSPSFAETARIGMISPNNGPYEELALEEYRGAAMAVEEINAKGDVVEHMLEIVPMSTGNLLEDVEYVVEDLCYEHNVVAIIGLPDPKLASVVALETYKAKIPYISLLPAGTVTRFYEDPETNEEKLYPYVFNFYPGMGQYPDGIADFVAYSFAENKKSLKGALLMDVADSSSGDDSEVLHYKELFADNGWDLSVAMMFDSGASGSDAEYAPFLKECKKVKPDVLILDIPSDGQVLAEVLKKLRAEGLKQPIVCTMPFRPYFWEGMGKSLENTYWIGKVCTEHPEVVDFLKRYKKRFGEECKDPDAAIAGYNAVYLLKDAMIRAGTAEGKDSEKIGKAMAATKGLTLLPSTEHLSMLEWNFPDGGSICFYKANPEKRLLNYKGGFSFPTILEETEGEENDTGERD